MSFYPRLPDELKLMIWEEAIPKHGRVHHFKIGFDQPRAYQQTLTVYRFREAEDDPSSWVELWRLSATCRISWDLVNKDNRVLFWQKMSPQATKKAADMPGLPALEKKKTPGGEPDQVGDVPSGKSLKPTKAFINGDKDIVCFTLVGSDFDFEWLHWQNNRERFRCLTRVAMNFFYPVARRCSWVTLPFQCRCRQRCWANESTNFANFCPVAMAYFLQIFENLQEFYFIIPLTGHRLRKHDVLPRGTKREHGGQAIKKTAAQLATEAMDKFKGEVGFFSILLLLVRDILTGLWISHRSGEGLICLPGRQDDLLPS